MSSQDITYGRLLELVPAYAERPPQDAAFRDQIPTFITLAENRVATDLKQQGFKLVVNFTLPLDGVLEKPSWWKESVGLLYINAAGERAPIFLRDYHYCRNFAPNPATTGLPRFYADYNATNFLIVPTPATAFQAELSYYARLDPLSDANQANWLTLNAPQALLYATMREASIYLKEDKNMARWTLLYDAARKDLLEENSSRMSDENQRKSRG